MAIPTDARDENLDEPYGSLRRRILALELPPGAQLSRSALQAHYGVSSTPIRDALLRLREEGLVEIYPQSRTIVSRIDLSLAREAHFLRSAVERNIARELASDPQPPLIRKLRRIVALQEQISGSGELDVFSSLDQTFHETLFSAAGYMRTFAVVRRESVHVDRLRALHLPMGDKVERIVAEHGCIVDALEAGDPERADEAMAFHLSQSIAIASQLSQDWPGYFAA
ncbi:GntR family transcriptional regulator [Aquibium carbonis]|uniref:GntR family transcriptional regulator n=1 Tax=Aquibium carbonis TaxID=2495581 RepID=A0A3S0A986_9HYPH|nr:GntR family transcriptional regulator [Aquibium carbonis]RST87588.1 GntR family transcriptional regulator [Aquibium carbonis]